jgi:hypothetical protein
MDSGSLRGFAAAAFAAALASAIGLRAAAAEPASADSPKVVTGRLLDADGRPVAGGEVILLAVQWARSERPLGVYQHRGMPWATRVYGPFRADGEGRFRAGAAIDPAHPCRPYEALSILAAAEGHGLVRKALDQDARAQDVVLTLEKEHIVRGRLIDLQGQPAAMVRVQVNPGLLRETDVTPSIPTQGAFATFAPVTSDDKGRFLIRGLGQHKVGLTVRHDRFATQDLTAPTVPAGDAHDAAFSLVAAKVVHGRVTCGDTGKPAQDARVYAIHESRVVEGRTDAEGRFTLNPYPSESFGLTVFPADGEPYLVGRKNVSWSQAARQEVNIPLARGVLVRGTATELPSGKPVAGTLVQYRPRWQNNPYNKGKLNYTAYNFDWFHEALQTAVSDSAGAFRVAVPPGLGDLFVLGPTLDYVHVDSSIGDLEFGRASRARIHPDGLLALDLKPDDVPAEMTITLRRGVTLKGRVEAPDGTPVKKFMVLSRTYIPTGYELYQAFWTAIEARDGVFELPGCDPDNGGTAWFLDKDHALGTTLNFTGTEASGPPLSVRLEPCGAARIHYVDQAGKPVAKHQPQICIQFRPGTYMAVSFLSDKDEKDLEGDWGDWSNYHFKREWCPATDDQGWTTYRGLIPGADYFLTAWDLGFFDARKGCPKTEFRVKPGETLTLPDYVLKR